MIQYLMYLWLLDEIDGLRERSSDFQSVWSETDGHGNPELAVLKTTKTTQHTGGRTNTDHAALQRGVYIHLAQPECGHRGQSKHGGVTDPQKRTEKTKILQSPA